MASPPLHQNQRITSLSSAAYIMKDYTSPVPIPHEASNYEELSMKETLQFSERLMELKSIKEQLYSAAEHFESSYLKHEQKQTQDNFLSFSCHSGWHLIHSCPSFFFMIFVHLFSFP
ncbi:hypothetical protein SAY87_014524 [Trapa incisa]|uniref:Uncharacterized protein n=1 Tax=Trapa incisa TaxID=236973 RepID=A0AAN7JLR0_9MYRT|nr:hypothetical protein SAY87_014524 [Trapa incisa]